MELKISCDASVKLKKMSGAKNVSCDLVDYEIDKDTLSGNMKIHGAYFKDDLDNQYPFSELVPFTVVFRDQFFKINEISSRNFNCNEVVNQGLECHFDIVIDYEKISEDVKTEKVEEINMNDDFDLFTDPEFNEDIIIEDEEYIDDEKISEKYDDMLQDILSKRDDNFLEEEKNQEENIPLEERIDDIDEDIEDIINETEEDAFKEIEQFDEDIEEIIREDGEIKQKSNVSISTNAKIETIEPLSKRLKERYDHYKVYFVSKESDVDRICQTENLDINEAYKDFSSSKRIIVK